MNTEKKSNKSNKASTTVAPATPQPNFNNIRVYLTEKDALRATVSCKVGDLLWLTGLRVIQGSHGLFICMPTQKTMGGEYQDIYFPASKAVREEMQAAILAAYEAAKATECHS